MDTSISNNKKRTIYDIVYENRSDKSSMRKKLGISRPLYFSFIRILNYNEVIRLILLGTFSQLASYINLNEDHPEQNHKIRFWPLMYYMYGSSAGLAFLAIYSDCFTRQHMLFAPI